LEDIAEGFEGNHEDGEDKGRAVLTTVSADEGHVLLRMGA
jgi:hypothetical protein